MKEPSVQGVCCDCCGQDPTVTGELNEHGVCEVCHDMLMQEHESEMLEQEMEWQRLQQAEEKNSV